jgi:polysaccharide pyruvyl transferase WcaK-like protein
MPTNVPPRRIYFFGVFGAGNLGNECTLQAFLGNLRRYDQSSEPRCICSHPAAVSADYGIAAFSMREAPLPSVKNRALRAIRRCVLGIAMELYRWHKAFNLLRHDDVLIMTGTGMLGDFGIRPFDLHYDILRWSIIAKLRRCKLFFVSVGAGPIRSWPSRLFVKQSLALGDYRSYRDNFSHRYLKQIGVKVDGDVVRPDLAFSFPKDAIPLTAHRSGKRIVAVGLMEYHNRVHDPARPSHYACYVDQLASLVTWLLDRHYVIRLLIGDAVYDKSVGERLLEVLKLRGHGHEPGQIINEPARSVQEVLCQIASSDYVVASRFHNVLLALMLARPVLAVSYHEKVHNLMGDMGMGEYCEDIEQLDIDVLSCKFSKLESNTETLTRQIAGYAQKCRKRLDDQYADLFGPALDQDVNATRGEVCWQ